MDHQRETNDSRVVPSGLPPPTAAEPSFRPLLASGSDLKRGGGGGSTGEVLCASLTA